jgi:hypothetical protein
MLCQAGCAEHWTAVLSIAEVVLRLPKLRLLSIIAFKDRSGGMHRQIAADLLGSLNDHTCS